MNDDDDVMTTCLNIMRRMPPQDVKEDLIGLMNLVPSAADEMLQRVDQPLQEAVDATNGRTYLLCDYNRDGDSYRSPWSNKYSPEIEDGEEGFFPSDSLRRLEVQANEIFDSYRKAYYKGGASSVYMWDLDASSFAACFLVKKDVKDQRFVKAGSWHSIHVIEVLPTVVNNVLKKATYKLTTTVMLDMGVQKAEIGKLNLSGNLTRQAEKSIDISSQDASEGSFVHVSNMGQMIEDMEIEIRSNLDVLYIGKTREVVNGLRKLNFNADAASTNLFVGELGAALLRKKKAAE